MQKHVATPTTELDATLFRSKPLANEELEELYSDVKSGRRCIRVHPTLVDRSITLSTPPWHKARMGSLLGNENATYLALSMLEYEIWSSDDSTRFLDALTGCVDEEQLEACSGVGHDGHYLTPLCKDDDDPITLGQLAQLICYVTSDLGNEFSREGDLRPWLDHAKFAGDWLEQTITEYGMLRLAGPMWSFYS